MAEYTVKQASELAHLKPATVRAWEARYGVVAPGRSASGYRLYDEEDVRRLRRMATLVRDGTPPALAARRLRTPGGGEASGERADASGEARTAPAPGRAVADGVSAHPDTDHGWLVDLARVLDPTSLEDALELTVASGDLERVIEHRWLPALGRVGDAWRAGELDVAAEHFASGAITRRLSAAFDRALPGPHAPVALVGLPAGARHEIGGLAFATFLRRSGVDVRWLGADVPDESWRTVAAALRPDVLVVATPRADDAPATDRAVRAVRDVHPDQRVAVGGRGAEAVTATVLRLPASPTQAVLDLAEALRGVDDPPMGAPASSGGVVPAPAHQTRTARTMPSR